MALLLGYDIGSSSIKATLMETETGEVLAAATSPEKELEIIAKSAGWAEQHPHVWWDHVKLATRKIKSGAKFEPFDVRAIGISYQMHGLVAVDKNREVLRPAIIWCDSRAVQIGQKAARDIGQEKCLKRLLNLPGNFTASKLKWVMENEPDIFSKIHKIMLPGDYIAMKMTGRIATTPSGLSEGIMWDFENDELAEFVLENYGITADLIAETIPTFSIQGELTAAAAEELGLKSGTKVSYRAGDQPNNALSLGVLNPGQIAVTAGTSGVVYGISDKKNYDQKSRVNIFVHVNHSAGSPRYGVLLCLNGTGILNSWLKHNLTANNEAALTYDQMNKLALEVPVGSDGLVVLPYGNGAERTLENSNIGASVHGWNFNIHKKAHFLRAAQEGIVFALNFGLGIMRKMGIELATARAGNANMFLSPLFAEAFATVTKTAVELYNTDGSQGAARGAGIGAGIYDGEVDAFVGLKPVKTIEPNDKLTSQYGEAYEKWKRVLESELGKE
ncbi:MAG TPA: FGGY family carbohydrate kinase [Sedimentisphaerales bacterium]|nr:FGGY family carbohydrate kinase [Sedimentisphaerales bacterium]